MSDSRQDLARPTRRARSQNTRELLGALPFIAPWIIGFIIFTAGPMIYSLFLSFTQYDILSPPRFTGLANYQKIASDPKLMLSLGNTFFYAALHVPLVIMVSLGLALLLNQVGRAAGLFRTAYYLPSITPAVAVGTLWLWLLNPRIGLINRALNLVGIQGPGWTTDPAWIKPGIVLMSLWGVGGTVIIFLAALKDVPKEMYEASRIDGASPARQFFSITLPLISGTIFFILIVNTIASLQIFAEVYTMYFGQQATNAGSDAALFYVIYLFRQAFEFLSMGYASAMAWVLFIIIMILTAIQLYFSKRWVYYGGGG